MFARPSTTRTRRPRRSPLLMAGLAGLAVVVVGACSSDGREMRPPEYPLPPVTTAPPPTVPIDTVGPIPAAQPMQLITPWPDLGLIPARNTCDDIDISPALSWNGVPPGTVELALTLTDLDADLTHWIMYAIDPVRTGIGEGEVPQGALTFGNDLGSSDWVGPCPPPGDAPHYYLLTLHALNQQLELADNATSDELVATLNQTSIAQSSITGTYARGA